MGSINPQITEKWTIVNYNPYTDVINIDDMTVASPKTCVYTYRPRRSLMAEWLEQASQWHEMYCHDLEVASWNPSQVELGVHSASVLSSTWIKNIY